MLAMKGLLGDEGCVTEMGTRAFHRVWGMDWDIINEAS
jgi:hypothetical protein